jgi:hypothetical protein
MGYRLVISEQMVMLNKVHFAVADGGAPPFGKEDRR